MTDVIKPAVAEADKEPASKKNISVEDYILSRSEQLKAKAKDDQQMELSLAKDQLEETVEDKPEAEESPKKSEATKSAPSESSKNVLSQIDLDDLSESDLKELSKRLGPGAVARFGEMTARRKAAEKELRELKESIKNPDAVPKRKVRNNPYANLETIEAVEEMEDAAEATIDWAEDIFFKNEGSGPDDVVTHRDGTDYKKSEVRESWVNARRALNKELPSRKSEIVKASNELLLKESRLAETEEEKKKFLSLTEGLFPWYKDPENPVRKHYETVLEDDLVVKMKAAVEKEVPELSARMDHILAHYTNSLGSVYGRRPIPDETEDKSLPSKQSSPRLTPSFSSVPDASVTEKSEPKKNKAQKESEQRFRESGNTDDYVTMRTLQLQNRKQIE